jgi:hypothetical protein
MNGTALKVKRIEAHVQGQALGVVLREMFPDRKWSAARVSRIEARAHVDPMEVAEYEAGLATFTTNTTSAVA